MNYLLAPFLFLLSPPLSASCRRSLLLLYSSFITTFVPNTFADDEFGSLQCVFLLFRHLLLYHDPQLCAHLDANEMGPELYASSWFITLYANRCKMEVVLYLWDIMLLEAATDPMLHYFVSLALLIANRAVVLKEPNVSLPEQLTKLTIANRKDAHTLVQRAKQLYRHNTSRSVRDKLRHITHARISIDSPAYTQLQQWQALHVSADEVVQHILQRGVAKVESGSSAQDSKDEAAAGGATSTEPDDLKFFVLDCRPLPQYNSGHLPMSFHLDPELLEERRAEELERRLDALSGMRGCHLCFADATVDEEQLDSSAEASNNAPSPQLAFLSLMLRRHFKYLSIITGGFAACHARILSVDRSSELIDHRPDDCLECNGKRFSRKEKRSLFNSVSAGMKRLGMGMIARLDQQQNSASTTAATATEGAAATSHYYSLSAEHKAEHVPDGVLLLHASQQLRLLLTVCTHSATSFSHPTDSYPAAVCRSSSCRVSIVICVTAVQSLRDRNSDDAVFAVVVARLCAILVGTAMERIDIVSRSTQAVLMPRGTRKRVLTPLSVAVTVSESVTCIRSLAACTRVLRASLPSARSHSLTPLSSCSPLLWHRMCSCSKCTEDRQHSNCSTATPPMLACPLPQPLLQLDWLPLACWLMCSCPPRCSTTAYCCSYRNLTRSRIPSFSHCSLTCRGVAASLLHSSCAASQLLGRPCGQSCQSTPHLLS